MLVKTNKIIEIIQGEKVVFDVFLTDEDGRPFDLTSFDTFRFAAKKTNNLYLLLTQVAVAGSSIQKKTGVSDQLGHLVVTISETDTALLATGFRLDFEIKIDNGVTANPKKAIFEDVLDVAKSNT